MKTKTSPKSKKKSKGKAASEQKSIAATRRKKLKKKDLNPVALNREAKELYEVIVSDDNAGSHMRELAYMLKTNATLIRRMSKELRTADRVESRLVYAMSTLMSQQREVIADIRAVADHSKQIELISSTILQPTATSQAQVLTGMFYQLRRLITEVSKPKQAQFALRQLENVMSDIARETQANFESMNKKIRDILSTAA